MTKLGFCCWVYVRIVAEVQPLLFLTYMLVVHTMYSCTVSSHTEVRVNICVCLHHTVINNTMLRSVSTYNSQNTAAWLRALSGHAAARCLVLPANATADLS